jgi:hypothetical protein
MRTHVLAQHGFDECGQLRGVTPRKVRDFALADQFGQFRLSLSLVEGRAVEKKKKKRNRNTFNPVGNQRREGRFCMTQLPST